MKLTIFTLPKRFEDPFATIQQNALASWRALRPAPDLMLFGDEPGTREAARRHAAQHIPEITRNHLGTPLVNHLFQTATRHATTPYQAYVNADIVLDPGITALSDKIVQWRPRVLIVSRRWDFDVHEPLDFSVPDTFSRLAAQARRDGALYTHHGMDVFIFPTGLFDHMPPFSIGWPGAKYDNWLIYAARRAGVPVVDITDALTNVHQNHPAGGKTDPVKACEHWISLDHLGGHGCAYDILDATHLAGADGSIRRRPRTWSDRRRSASRFRKRLRYQLKRRLFGFTHAGAQAKKRLKNG